jgi:acetyl-CoA acetyltransferase family protein
MSEVFLCDALRTPVGKPDGCLKSIRPDDMAALVLKKIVERNKLDPATVDEVYFGCANHSGEDCRNVARMAVLLAGFPHTIPAVTVNRLCSSGLEAAASAYRAIMAGEGRCFIAGGVESMTRAPLSEPNQGERISLESMGETAENIHEQWNIKRELQDQFALESHQKAILAQSRNLYKDEIIPVEIEQDHGGLLTIDKDENPREDITLEELASLKSDFRKGGTVTSGNSAALADGAAALLICSGEYMKEHGLTALVKLRGSASAGVDPRIMGIGPVSAVEKLLNRIGISRHEIGLWEIHEAFAVQALAVIAELDPDIDRVNPMGGAIAIGHPAGMSGARMLGTLAHSMRSFGVKYGIATLCVNAGQGQAMLVELP